MRPGNTAAAFYFSSAEVLTSPVAIPYLLKDAQFDSAWRIIPEYSPNGGGLWLPASQGPGGDGIIDLNASPEGVLHYYSWDAEVGGAAGDNYVFRISVEWQAPDYVGYPIQRPRLSSVSPPFRLRLPPGEVRNLILSCDLEVLTLLWDPLDGADFYNVYRGGLINLTSGSYDHTNVGLCGIVDTTDNSQSCAWSGENSYYLVVGKNGAGEGSYGFDSVGGSRASALTPCP